MSNAPTAAVTKQQIIDLSHVLGFSQCRFTRAELPQEISNNLKSFVDKKYHGTMAWIEETFMRRTRPRAMWPEAKTAIMLAMNYGPEIDPLENLERREVGSISVYAQNRDYHDLIKGRLKQIAQKIAASGHCQVKVFVDTAPLMEKPLAHQAGIGWQGKHTNLVSREFGSWLFLGCILTDASFAEDAPEIDHCGSCRACLDICPTGAFPSPYKLDARKCISYLTIEHQGLIPVEFRVGMGNRIYGCDDCLAVCPWNKFAKSAGEIKLKARPDLMSPDLHELATLDDAAFRARFSGSPVKRIGRNRFIRNVLVAIGNSASLRFIPVVKSFLNDPDPVLRAMSVWALSRLATREAFLYEKKRHILEEIDPSVLHEWQNVPHNNPSVESGEMS